MRILKKIKDNQETIEEYQKTEKEKVYNNKTDKTEKTQDKDHKKEDYDGTALTKDENPVLEIPGSENKRPNTEKTSNTDANSLTKNQTSAF